MNIRDIKIALLKIKDSIKTLNKEVGQVDMVVENKIKDGSLTEININEGAFNYFTEGKTLAAEPIGTFPNLDIKIEGDHTKYYIYGQIVNLFNSNGTTSEVTVYSSSFDGTHTTILVTESIKISDLLISCQLLNKNVYSTSMVIDGIITVKNNEDGGAIFMNDSTGGNWIIYVDVTGTLQVVAG